MKYGIYIGDYYSAICRIENKVPVIIKTDTLKDFMPTCVSITRKNIINVGDSAYNDYRHNLLHMHSNTNVFYGFVRTLGTNILYGSKSMDHSFSSEELTAFVLKKLISTVKDDSVRDCVITIPAKFKTDQIAATKRAAVMAGIEHCVLLQEPIAASMAYGLNSDKKNGMWLVINYDNYRFDASLFKIEDGIMHIQDTESDNYFGGKNIDYAIIDQMLIPYLKSNYTIDDILADDTKKQILRDAMVFYAEQAMDQLSCIDKCEVITQCDELGEDDEGEVMELDMVITQDQISKVISPIYQIAVDISKRLLNRNNIKGCDLNSLVLIGSSTNSPIFRSKLKEQITPNVDTSIDPQTAIVKGAAIYAFDYLIEDPREKTVNLNNCTIALDLFYDKLSMESVQLVAVRLIKDKCLGDIPSKVFIEFTRNDKGWSSGKIEINEIGDVAECPLLYGKTNSFLINAYDDKGNMFACSPNKLHINSAFAH